MLDLENNFINLLLAQSNFDYVMREGVGNELLESPLSKSMYQFIKSHNDKSRSVPTERVLEEEFPTFEFRIPETQIEYIVEKLRWRYQKNNVQDITLGLAQKAEDPEDAMKYLRQRVVEVDRAVSSSNFIRKAGDHKILLANIQKKILEGGYKGASIGFKDIDAFTGGVKPGHAVYLLARPKRKKSFLLLNAFIEQAKDGKRPFLFNNELTENELFLRLCCILTGISWDKTQKEQLMPKDWDKFKKAWDEFEKYEHWHETSPVDQRSVSSMFMRADKVGAESVFISQFKYVRGTKDYYRNSYDEAAEIAVDLKSAATRSGKEMPVIIEAQFNRWGDEMEGLDDFEPSKVGLTDMIPQSADALFGIYESKDMRANNQLEFGVLEARSHGVAKWFIFNELVSHTEFSFQAGSQH